jgi:hypothetical protein
MRRFSAKRSLRTGRHWHQLKSLQAAVLVLLCCLTLSAKPLHHYVFFGMDREQIKDAKSFFETEAFEGAQIAYSWRQLEPAKDEYDFSLIREDLALMEPHGKKLWIQIQDVTFNPERKNVPKYLLNDPIYNGGAAQQYNDRVPDQQNPPPGGWMARRWDPAVQERLHKLLFALAKEFDGRVEGVNFDESAGGFSQNPALYPKGFSHAAYRDGIITNMKALKRAFAKSVALQYANFMPGEWRPTNDKGYLRAVYQAARENSIGVGGPDLFPYKPGQMGSSYSLIHALNGKVPVGIAVQDGNYDYINPKTGRRVTNLEQIKFAKDYLKADYIFWCTQEPFFSRDVVPVISSLSH